MRPDLITQKQWIKYNLYLLVEHFIGLKNSEKYIRPKRNKLYNEVLTNDGFQNRGRALDLKEIEYDSFEPFANNKAELIKKPLVFRGVAKDWPCVKNWDKQFFREKYSDTTVPLVDYIPGIRESEGSYSKINFAQYFEEIEKGTDIYLSFSRLLDNNPVLLEDLDLNWLRQFQSGLCNGEQTFFFMGEEGTKTDMHNGFTHTIFIQINGRKKWTVYAPNERFFLDPVAARFTHYYSHANPHDENDPRYPLLKYAQKYELILEPGDVLWFPSLFWHYVENITPNIGVAYKYVNVPQSFQISSLLTSLILMATKPSLLESFIYNKIHKQDLVFNK